MCGWSTQEARSQRQLHLPFPAFDGHGRKILLPPLNMATPRVTADFAERLVTADGGRCCLGQWEGRADTCCWPAWRQRCRVATKGAFPLVGFLCRVKFVLLKS